jgi:4-diphosphocytidyl-2-C-methyl-D-erythritol kinase
MAALTEPASAKVNLYLHVTGRRADGYHLLDSLAVFPDVGDVLRVMPCEGLSLELTGPFGTALRAEPDNLVLRAARALAQAGGIAPHGRITLEKNLPLASGIGGGSADAAAALRLLSRHWNIRLPPAELARIAVALGADVPVCLASVPAGMRGVGEQLTAAPALPALGMVLLNPGVAVATPAVFKARRDSSQGGFTPEATWPAGWGDAAALIRFLATTRNDLEAPAVSLAPAIATALAALWAEPGCLLARMSGSGATCFGLFANAAAAHSAALRVSRPGWWSWGGAMRGSSASEGLPERGLTP